MCSVPVINKGCFETNPCFCHLMGGSLGVRVIAWRAWGLPGGDGAQEDAFPCVCAMLLWGWGWCLLIVVYLLLFIYCLLIFYYSPPLASLLLRERLGKAELPVVPQLPYPLGVVQRGRGAL